MATQSRPEAQKTLLATVVSLPGETFQWLRAQLWVTASPSTIPSLFHWHFEFLFSPLQMWLVEVDRSLELNTRRGSVRCNNPELEAFRTPTQKMGCMKFKQKAWTTGTELPPHPHTPGRHRESVHPRQPGLCFHKAKVSSHCARLFVWFGFKSQDRHL